MCVIEVVLERRDAGSISMTKPSGRFAKQLQVRSSPLDFFRLGSTVEAGHARPDQMLITHEE